MSHYYTETRAVGKKQKKTTKKNIEIKKKIYVYLLGRSVCTGWF